MLDLNQGVRGQAYSHEDGITDYVTDDGTLSRVQDVTAIIEANKIAQNSVQRCGFKAPETYRRVASIPRAVFDLAKAQGIDLMRDDSALRQFLNDPDNRLFRTRLERV